MATDMVTGYFYFVESNTDNIEWVPTVDDIIVGALYTEGTEYVKLQIPKHNKIGFVTGIIVKDSGAGSSFDTRDEARSYRMLSEGVETTLANAVQIMNFFMLPRHTSGSSTTYKQVYMVIKTGAATYVKFVNAAGSPVDYCKGAVISGDVDWDQDDSLRGTIRLNWRSVW